VPLRTSKAASDAAVLRTRLRIVDEGNPTEEVMVLMEEVPMGRALLSTTFLQNMILVTALCRSAIEIDTRNAVTPSIQNSTSKASLKGKFSCFQVPLGVSCDSRPKSLPESLDSDISLASDSSTCTHVAEAIVQ
jgi:hypothetical protein